MQPRNEGERAVPAVATQPRHEAATAAAATAAAGTPPAKKPGLLRRALEGLYNLRISTVFYWFWASLGLGLAGAQIQTKGVVVAFAVFWGITVIAMLGLAARMIGNWNARHHRPAPHA
ncbi:hypothetical protein ACIGXM_10000 [Kitasatospora sp. NPDC052896]|uniref:hypothetical protein n=1 Tax=Kitasatospora sp. NPDC052896 TaxID=3364061 RepID=UPI0037C628FE